MDISPDSIIYWQWGAIKLSATILFSWVVMALLVIISWLVTRNLSVKPEMQRWQNLLESIVEYTRSQIKEVVHQQPDQYLPFIGTLFLFISLANLLGLVPGFNPPTGSINTTAALAVCVFFAVPLYGIMQSGLKGYFNRYLQPTVFMLPFHIIGELSRTLSLAVRLFGNIMSGTLIVAILLSVTPLFLPIVMQLLGLLIGQIQAYIFAMLALVYIASGASAQQKGENHKDEENQ
ncbi:F0F1 ATP synthase subunit A [candidate division KSB1 bacterium]|nr:F0F1 ATP synthase subunit A [candidate division KSB1 bacterium]